MEDKIEVKNYMCNIVIANDEVALSMETKLENRGLTSRTKFTKITYKVQDFLPWCTSQPLQHTFIIYNEEVRHFTISNSTCRAPHYVISGKKHHRWIEVDEVSKN